MQSLNVQSVQSKLKQLLGYQWHLISSRMKADIYIALFECNISLEEIKDIECGKNIIVHTTKGLIVFRSNSVLGYSDN
jgi:hypothetical protein